MSYEVTAMGNISDYRRVLLPNFQHAFRSHFQDYVHLIPVAMAR